MKRLERTSSMLGEGVVLVVRSGETCDGDGVFPEVDV